MYKTEESPLMDHTDRNTLIALHVQKFGLPIYKGHWYMKQILLLYVEIASSGELAIYNKLVSEVSEKRGIRPGSMKRAIKYYVNQGWALGMRKDWQTLTGWDQDDPPDVNTAIRLICESFIPITEKYQAAFQWNE